MRKYLRKGAMAMSPFERWLKVQDCEEGEGYLGYDVYLPEVAAVWPQDNKARAPAFPLSAPLYFRLSI